VTFFGLAIKPLVGTIGGSEFFADVDGKKPGIWDAGKSTRTGTKNLFRCQQ